MNTAQNIASNKTANRGVLGFFSELGRRKVYRAATAYAVVLWLVYQVVDLVAPELRLPEWTLRFVIFIGLLGFPITLILSWLFEITPQGIVIDGNVNASRRAASREEPTRPFDRAIDCSLVVAALVIGTQLALNSVGTATASAIVDAQKIVVTPFQVSGSAASAEWSDGLVIELQHELASQTNLTVIAPRDPYDVADSVVLTGALSVTREKVHVTVTLVDADTDIVSWSKTLECTAGESLRTPVKVARRIVAALPMVKDDAEITVAHNVSQ